MGATGRIGFSADANYRGEGISLGLARGLLAEINGVNLTQEGMGIGAIACRHAGFTWFSRDSRTETLGEGFYRKWYSLDSRVIWQLAGRQSRLFTRFLEAGADAYMKVPGLQVPLMVFGTFLRKLFRVRARFVPAAPIASAVFDYTVRGDRVDVACAVEGPAGLPSRIFVMNELGADFFCRGLDRERAIEPPSGWQPIAPGLSTPVLYDPAHRLRFSVDRLFVDPVVPARIFWGRERFSEYCWAGFEFQLDLGRFRGKSIAFTYSVLVEQG